MDFIFPLQNKYKHLRLLGFLLLASALLFYFAPSDTEQDLQPVLSPPEQHPQISFSQQIKPLLDKRCVVCHSCYDSPCQLKLSSTEGILRGASKEKVYNPRRLTAIPPTRLFIDAKTTKDWRKMGFYSVLQDNSTAANAENKSLLQKLLELKQQYPQANSGKLGDEFSLELDRQQSCASQQSFDDYARDHPLWGMPYGLPNLKPEESRLLINWLETGAAMEQEKKFSGQATAQIKKWEIFLNTQTNKQRLVSRYLYEHLFQAHIHFRDTPADEFYRLVRSTTGAPDSIDEIASIRPYDNPGITEFYYRLLPYQPTIVAKNHIVYEFSDQRMKRYQQLFIQPDYPVDNLPSYDTTISSNPFKVFAAIPPNARYRFLLDDARFFIEGFVKGPVCRGQIALSVIEDQFWVVFFDPDKQFFTTQASFLNNMSDYLRIPSERESHLNLLAIWTEYWQQQKQYITSKQKYFEQMQTHSLDHAMSYIWNGDGNNPNAALTVFRHFDSATVDYGLIGEEPETAWIIDYPLLERIHYLLVAGFNVYGNVVHQLSTRIYMDFLRMEGEDYFLSFLPVSRRKEIRDTWYQGMRAEQEVFFKTPMDWLTVESVIGYQTDNVQAEFYSHIKERMGESLVKSTNINHCGKVQCPQNKSVELDNKINQAMEKISRIGGSRLHAFPEVSFLRIETDQPDEFYVYSLLRNKAYKNIVSLLSDELIRDRQDIDKDSLTVINWLEGSYPNFFFSLHVNELDSFVQHCADANNQQSFDKLVERFGIRRTHPKFWQIADWFQQYYVQQGPVYSGLLDLSRYNNL